MRGAVVAPKTTLDSLQTSARKGSAENTRRGCGVGLEFRADAFGVRGGGSASKTRDWYVAKLGSKIMGHICSDTWNPEAHNSVFQRPPSSLLSPLSALFSPLYRASCHPLWPSKTPNNLRSSGINFCSPVSGCNAPSGHGSVGLPAGCQTQSKTPTQAGHDLSNNTGAHTHHGYSTT